MTMSRQNESLNRTSCGRSSPGNLTFDHNIKMEFITDETDIGDGNGFYTKIYSEGESLLSINRQNSDN